MKIERSSAAAARTKHIADIPSGMVFDGIYVSLHGPWLKTDEGSIVQIESGFEYTKRHVDAGGGREIVNYQPLHARLVIDGPDEEAE